jgi:microcystin-dependent protein
MPSSYSPRLRLELQATGENRSTWGLKGNNDFSLLESSIAGSVTIAMADADLTLTALNGAADQARMAILIFTGTLTADRTVTMPTVSKTYIVANFTTGGKNVLFKTASIGANSVAVGSTVSQTIWTDGASTYIAIPNITKAYVGLGNVDNTSDMNKPVSTAQAAYVTAASPVGSIVMMPGTTAPPNFIGVNGNLISRAAYPALWTYAQASGNIASTDAIWNSSTLYGSFSPGDGSSTFRVPDYRGYKLRAWDNGRGVDSGRAMGSLQGQSIQSHNHTVSDPGHNHGYSDPGHAHSIADSGHAHGVGDPGHSHTVTGKTHPISGVSYSGIGGDSGSDRTLTTSAVGTGIWIGGAGTGIGIYGAGVGITIASKATGITIADAGSAETRSANIATNYFIKYQ